MSKVRLFGDFLGYNNTTSKKPRYIDIGTFNKNTRPDYAKKGFVGDGSTEGVFLQTNVSASFRFIDVDILNNGIIYNK